MKMEVTEIGLKKCKIILSKVERINLLQLAVKPFRTFQIHLILIIIHGGINWQNNGVASLQWIMPQP